MEIPVYFLIIYTTVSAALADAEMKFSPYFVSKEIRAKKGDRITINVGENANVKYMPAHPQEKDSIPTVIDHGILVKSEVRSTFIVSGAATTFAFL